MKRLVWILALALPGCGWLALAQQTTELPGNIFSVKKTWVIGGEGNWDYMTLDPVALQLYIAHGAAVQVVDVSAGALSGQVTGLRDAHGIALDDAGQFGYVSDGTASELDVFDRRTLEIVARVPTGKNPRAVVFEPVSRLVFAICPSTAAVSRIPRTLANGQRGASSGDPSVQSTVTVIDAETQKRLADLILPGKLGFAQADGRGTVYVSVTDRGQVGYFDVEQVGSRLRRRVQAAASDADGAAKAQDAAKGTKAGTAVAAGSSSAGAVGVGSGKAAVPGKAGDALLTIDWSDTTSDPPSFPNPLKVFRLGRDCQSPSALAVDSTHMRIFAACDNRKLEVLNSVDGQVVATLPIGEGTDAVGYDANHGLIFTSNGGGLGSLTVIRQHLSDSYAVIQELPTQSRARTLAVNPDSGEVYLVTNLQGFDVSKSGTGGSAYTLPVVQATPVSGSFQVLVIGN